MFIAKSIILIILLLFYFIKFILIINNKLIKSVTQLNCVTREPYKKYKRYRHEISI